jgi:hypothetical protein
MNQLFRIQNGTSIVPNIILKYLRSNDPTTLLHIITFQYGILLASKGNIIEKADLLERSSQINMLLLEIFKCESLDKTDYLLQLLMPDLDFQLYDQYISGTEDAQAYSQMIQNEQKIFILLNCAHCMKSDGRGVLRYCLKKGLKFIFQCSQISGISSSVFNSTLAPSDLRMKRVIDTLLYSQLYYFGYIAPTTSLSIYQNLLRNFNDFISYYTSFNSISIFKNKISVFLCKERCPSGLSLNCNGIRRCITFRGFKIKGATGFDG